MVTPPCLIFITRRFLKKITENLSKMCEWHNVFYPFLFVSFSFSHFLPLIPTKPHNALKNEYFLTKGQKGLIDWYI